MPGVLKPYQPKKRYVPKNVKHEESLQLQVCGYLDIQYPRVIYRSDYASGLHLTPGQAVKHKRMQSSRAWADLFIYAPRKVEDKFYCGLAIELKKQGTTIILKTGPRKGRITSDPHIQEQALLLKELNSLGYYADFAIGFDKAVALIDWYFGKPENGQLF